MSKKFEFDWHGMLRIALGKLRLLPEQFWDLTPCEFLLLAGVRSDQGASLNRRDLTALCASFPDELKESQND